MIVIYTNLDIGREGVSTLEGLTATLVAEMNELMTSTGMAHATLTTPLQGGASAGAEQVALRTLRHLQEAQEQMQEYRAHLAYYCSRCTQEECEAPGKRDSQGVRHSPVNFIAAVLLRLAEVVRLLQDVPATREAMAAAVVARNAAIEGDSDTVNEFSRRWLGLQRPEEWREAVEMALLGDWVDALGRGAATDSYVQGLLRRHADAEHRALQPLWERRVRGERSVLLSQPLNTPTLTVADLLVEHHTPEAEVLAAELTDSRLATVLRTAQPEETACAWYWAKSGESWAEAAAAAGRPAVYGERVRTKLKRLGRQYTMRAAAASATCGSKAACPSPE